MGSFFKNRAAVWLSTALVTVAILSPVACTHRAVHPETPLSLPAVTPWTPASYRSFISENIALMDLIYSDEYIDYPFTVEVENGSISIQQLIDVKAVQTVAHKILPAEKNSRQILNAARQYVATMTQYQVHPYTWPTVPETLKTGKADCKGRSLLLLSLLLATGQEAYAAIGNGHVWVVMQIEGRWQTIETDPDPERLKVYRIPGFYDRPLYKIFADKTVKRRRRQ